MKRFALQELILVLSLFMITERLVAGTFTVTNTNDAGAGSLRQAMIDANAAPGFDVIDMTGASGTITLASMLPIITESVTIVGPGTGLLIVSGNNQYRVMFVQSGFVELRDFTIANGRAQGGNGADDGGGGGAGMGGAIFVNNGDVLVRGVVFNNHVAKGGQGGRGDYNFYGGGGGGMRGAGGAANGGGGGGGGFTNNGGASGSNGGNGAADPFFAGGTAGTAGEFGLGGAGNNGGGGGGDGDVFGGNGGNGGFGGGGGGGGAATAQGGDAGHGGFGGGGGGAGPDDSGNPNAGGNGGYGGGAGAGIAYTSGGIPGTFGGAAGSAGTSLPGAGGGAGLGGAVFVKSTGTFRMVGCSFTNCVADSGGRGLSFDAASNGSRGQGKGGAIFIEPGGIVIDYAGNTFASNTARDQGGTGSDNHNQYGSFLSFPSLPVGLYAIAGNGRLHLKWRKNPEGTIVRYRILMGTSPNPTTQVDSTTGGINDTTKTVTGLTNGTLYYVRVVAVDLLDQPSLPSNEDAAVPVVEQGNALTLNGSNQHAQIAAASHLNFSQADDFTITAWINPSTYHNGQIYDKTANIGVFDALQIWTHVDADSSVYFKLGKEQIVWDVLRSNYRYVPGEWLHVAFVKSGNVTSLYINGQFDNQRTLSFTGAITNLADINVGRFRRDNSAFFEGSIDEVSVWSSALNGSQILATMVRPMRGDESGILGLWHFDEASGEAYDGTANALNGTLVNGASRIASGAMAPASPKFAHTIAKNEMVQIRWSRSVETDFQNYRVLIDVAPDFSSPFQTINTTDGDPADTVRSFLSLTNGALYYAGVIAIDSAGNLSDTTTDAAVPVVEQGNALTLDETNWIDVGSHLSVIEGRNRGSISGWFKTDSAGAVFSLTEGNAGIGNWMQVIVGPQTSFYTDESFGFSISRGGFNQLRMYVRKGESYYLDNRWHHFVICTGDGDNRMVIDGVRETVDYATGGPTTNEFSDISNPSHMRIGARRLSSADDVQFNGQLDEITIWSGPLSDFDVRQLLSKPDAGIRDSLLLGYHFDEPGGAVVYDMSRNARDGATVGSPLFFPSSAMVPLIPRNLLVTPGATNGLNWDRNVETDILNYRIYRDTTASFITGEWIGTAPDTFFVDAWSIGGVDYYYAVTAIDSVTNEGDRSANAAGTSTIGSLVVAPASTIDFDTVLVGDSARVTIRVFSNGGSVIVDSARLVWGTAFSRPSGSPLPDTLFTLDTLVGVFQFKPTDFTTYTDTILVFSNAAGGPLRIPLSGTGFGNTAPFAFFVKPVGMAGLTNSATPTLSWNGRGDADGHTLSYIVQISTASDFATLSFEDTTNDTTLIVSTSLAEGNFYWQVRAEDGYGGQRTSNTGFFRVDRTAPALSMGILRSTVLRAYTEVYILAQERLPSVSGTFTLDTTVQVTLTPIPGTLLYSVPYKLMSDGTLTLTITGTDSAGNADTLTRDYGVIGVSASRAFTLEGVGYHIQGSGIGDGYLVARRDEEADDIESGWKFLTGVEILTDGSTGELSLNVPYDRGQVDDERKIGLYEQRGGGWQYAGGEGSGGRLVVQVKKGGLYRALYNPDHEILPKKIELAQNYPNPFNPTTTIRFGLPTESVVRLTVFNILGQKIIELVNDVRPAGYHTVNWDGRNRAGQFVASGIYLYRLENELGVLTRKMLLIK